jgi:hypothetical protein
MLPTRNSQRRTREEEPEEVDERSTCRHNHNHTHTHTTDTADITVKIHFTTSTLQPSPNPARAADLTFSIPDSEKAVPGSGADGHAILHDPQAADTIVMSSQNTCEAANFRIHPANVTR